MTQLGLGYMISILRGNSDTVEALQQAIGKTIASISLDPEYNGGDIVDKDYGVHEMQFLLVNTDLGTFTVETHNEHNGYYGGFSLRCRKW